MNAKYWIFLVLAVVLSAGCLQPNLESIDEPEVRPGSTKTFVLNPGETVDAGYINITLNSIQQAPWLSSKEPEVDVRFYHNGSQLHGDVLKQNDSTEWEEYRLTFNCTTAQSFNKETSAKFTLQIAPTMKRR